MDNLCHTLAGAALGEAGLKRRTGLGTATLLIGANLPDVDVLAIPFGHGIDFRRGWTHGVLALLVLPLLLAALMLAWDRWVRRRGGHSPEHPVDARWLLALSAISILSHPTLDWLNTYGVRWLMPFSGRWFYGDAVFIVDPWMWAALAVGVVAAQRLDTPRPARAALLAVSLYAASMLAAGHVGREAVARVTGTTEDPATAMAGPVPINPFRRQVVARVEDGYRFGTLTWLPLARVDLLDGVVLPVGADDPAARAAALAPEAQRFLIWSRFPFFAVQRDSAGATVWMDDARYSTGRAPSFAAVRVRVPAAAETPAPPRP